MGLLFFYALIAISISFLCSIMESVLLSINVSYIQVLKQSRPKIGKSLEKLKKDLNISLSAILILNTIANTVGAAGVGAEAARVLGIQWVFYVSAGLTFLILIFSEIIPKTIGVIYHKELAPSATYVIRFFIFITYPVVLFANFVTKKISRKKMQSSITREELLASTLMSEDAGIINEKESDVIENILKLRKSKVTDILTPRSVVFAVDRQTTIEEMLKMEEVLKFSRIPVYEDTIDNVVGFVMSKAIFHQAIENKKIKIEKLMNPIFSIHENVSVSYALDLFIKKKEHMFVVLDSYEQTEGILTLEDCIETVLGVEIVDELDTTVDMRKLAKQKKQKKQRKKLEKKAQKLKNSSEDFIQENESLEDISDDELSFIDESKEVENNFSTSGDFSASIEDTSLEDENSVNKI